MKDFNKITFTNAEIDQIKSWIAKHRLILFLIDDKEKFKGAKMEWYPKEFKMWVYKEWGKEIKSLPQ